MDTSRKTTLGTTATVFCILTAFAVTACSSGRVRFAPPASLPDAATLITNIAERRDNLTAMRAVANLRYRTGDRSESAKHVLIVERPDRVRVEVVKLWGTVFALASQAGLLQAYVPSESTFYEGPATVANIERYLPIGIAIDSIIDHALATPPIASAAPSSTEFDGELIRLDQRTARGRRLTWFADPRTPTTYQEIDGSGAIRLEARYREFRDTEVGYRLPSSITLLFPPSDESIEITLDDPEANPDLPPGLFTLEAPDQARRVEL